MAAQKPTFFSLEKSLIETNNCKFDYFCVTLGLLNKVTKK